MIMASPVRIIEPYAYTYRCYLKAGDAGRTLIDLLCERFPYQSRSRWTERIQGAEILLDEQPTEPNTVIHRHKYISIYTESVTEPSVPDTLSIHEETEDYLLVNKPAPMPVHSGGRYHRNTVLGHLAEKGYQTLKTVHRLDAVTSGLLLLAKTTRFAQQASQAFIDGAVKHYYALVNGLPTEAQFTVDRPIFRKQGFVFDSGAHPEAKTALTRFEVVNTFEEGALVRCYPETGRTHQIRLHLRDVGCPIAGDLIYASAHANPLQTRAIALFNAYLSLPTMGLEFEIPYPSEWNTPTAIGFYRA
jgi:RluA family pseudouridine synthase